MKNVFLIIFTLILGFWSLPILAKEIDTEIAILWSKFPEKISVVKTRDLGKLPVDNADSIRVCGAGYFFKDLIYSDQKYEAELNFIKFNSKTAGFDKLSHYLSIEDSKYDGIFSSSNYYCSAFNINGESAIILRNYDAEHPHTMFIISGVVHIVWGLSVIDNNNILLICYGKICDRNNEKTNKSFKNTVKIKYLPQDISSIKFVGGGDNPLVIYSATVFNEKAIFCSNLNKLDAELDIKARINICSLIVQSQEFTANYYENKVYYFVPYNLNGAFMYYYKCLDENNCIAGVFDEGAVLLSGSKSFKNGTIASYGGYNTLVSDTFGPDVMFCINPYTSSGGKKCIGRETWRIDSVQGDTGDYQDLFYSDGKFYFIISGWEDGKSILKLEEVIP